MADNTIIGAAFPSSDHLRSILADGVASVEPEEPQVASRLFKIRAADSHGQRSSANILIDRMYSWRGYQANPLPDAENLDRITLVASDRDVVIGTMSVGFDGPEGLLVEDLFPKEVADLRAAGSRICEFTKLAVDVGLASKHVLASLFHVAYIYAYRIRGFDRLMIEVNPRHVRYYERVLGFQVLGPERINKRVNAPAVLLCLKFNHTQEQIGKYGGNPHLASQSRSLYPLAFSVAEEAGIVARLKRPVVHAEPPLPPHPTRDVSALALPPR
jgi:hypothetical protein